MAIIEVTPDLRRNICSVLGLPRDENTSANEMMERLRKAPNGVVIGRLVGEIFLAELVRSERSGTKE